MDSRRDFTSKKVFSGYFSELGEKANSALLVYSALSQHIPYEVVPLVPVNCGRAKKKRGIMRVDTIVTDPSSTGLSHLGRERRAITPMKRLSTVVGV